MHANRLVHSLALPLRSPSLPSQTRITFERVSVSDVGSHAWSLLSNVSSIAIVNSSATDVGGDGIALPLGTLTRDVLISNCTFCYGAWLCAVCRPCHWQSPRPRCCADSL